MSLAPGQDKRRAQSSSCSSAAGQARATPTIITALSDEAHYASRMPTATHYKGALYGL
jgi:hypothetical protein